ncbi:MAG: T9SS type A sorting domain-containing protein [Bacteroidia bacterium]
MKKVSLVIIVFLTSFLSRAQPNPGFEDWTNQFGLLEPDGWQTLNFLTMLTPPNPASAFRVGGIDAHSGNYALKLKTVYLNNKPDVVDLGDTTGGCYTGQIILTPVSSAVGFPYTGRPEKLKFWARYIPVGADEGRAGVLLKKTNGNGFDTVGFGIMYLTETPVYSFFEVDIDYKSNALPDSAVIAFATSKNSLSARVNSTMFVDDVSFSGYVGISESVITSDKVKLFPNPAPSRVEVTVESENAEIVVLSDMSGKELLRQPLINKYVLIDVGPLPVGMYMYDIRDNRNKVLFRDKLNVLR